MNDTSSNVQIKARRNNKFYYLADEGDVVVERFHNISSPEFQDEFGDATEYRHHTYDNSVASIVDDSTVTRVLAWRKTIEAV